MPYNIKRVCNHLYFKGSGMTHLLSYCAQYAEHIPSLRFQESIRGWHFSDLTCLRTSCTGASFPAVEITVCDGDGDESEGMSEDWHVYCAF